MISGALTAKNKRLRQQRLDAIESSLRIAFDETPVPTVTTVARRLGLRDVTRITKRFPDLSAALRRQRQEAAAVWRRPSMDICYCVHRVRNMETEKIGMREFRENLAGYLEGGRPLAITRHGETLGFFIPAQKRSRKAEVEAMRAAAKELDAMIAAWGASEDELVQEYKEIRRASREKKRNSQ